MRTLALLIPLALVGCATQSEPAPEPGPEPGRALGVGGVFFRTDNARETRDWYVEHLRMPVTEHGIVAFWRRDMDTGDLAYTVWGPFPRGTQYFGDSGQEYMLNLIVDDLDAVLARLRAAGVQIDDNVEDHEYGRFAWFTDPFGVRVELWQPTQDALQEMSETR